MSILRFAMVFGLLASSTSAFAGMGNGGHGMQQGMQGRQPQACLVQMNLTPEQREQIAAIHKEFDPQREKASAEMRTLRLQQRDLTLANASPEKVKEVEEKLATARAEKMRIQSAQQAKMDAILTPEQRTSCGAGRGKGMGRGR